MNNCSRIVFVLLTVTIVGGIVTAADKPGDGASTIKGAGIVMEPKADSITIWTDGEDDPAHPAKYIFDPGCDKSMIGKFEPQGIFGPDRVQFTYTKNGDTRAILTLKREPYTSKGQIIGTVMFSNDFWVAVKPKEGPMDGFALNFPPPADMKAKLLKLQKGDTVGIRFHTDAERHRIDSLEVAPPKPETPEKPAPPKTSVASTDAPAPHAAPPSVPAASQPAQTAEEQARAKFKMAQLYIDNGLKDRAAQALRDLVIAFPDTDTAKEAQAKLAELVK